jgi:hypothetical protein
MSGLVDLVAMWRRLGISPARVTLNAGVVEIADDDPVLLNTSLSR